MDFTQLLARSTLSCTRLQKLRCRLPPGTPARTPSSMAISTQLLGSMPPGQLCAAQRCCYRLCSQGCPGVHPCHHFSRLFKQEGQSPADLLTGSYMRRGDLLGRRFQPVSQSGGVIEPLREPYRIDSIAGQWRTNVQTRPHPRPWQLSTWSWCGQPTSSWRLGLRGSSTCYANMTNVHRRD